MTATIRRRLAATVYEALLLGAVALLVGFAMLPLVAPPPVAVIANGPVPLPDRPGRLLSFTCLFIVWGAYCVGFWSNGRRSLPMKTWKLALRTLHGAPPAPPKAALRYLACWVGPGCAIGLYAVLRQHGMVVWSLAPLTINYAWAIVDRDRQFLQDRIAGTRLLHAIATPAFTAPRR